MSDKIFHFNYLYLYSTSGVMCSFASSLLGLSDKEVKKKGVNLYFQFGDAGDWIVSRFLLTSNFFGLVSTSHLTRIVKFRYKTKFFILTSFLNFRNPIAWENSIDISHPCC